MWKITETSFDPNSQHHKETIFTIGNGYLCTRGSFEEGYPQDRRATFIHGVFDDVPVSFTELANAPDWLSMAVFLNGERLSLASGTILAYQRELDLRTGLLSRSVRWTSPGGITALIQFERFASLADEHLLSIRCRITPESDCQVEIRAGLNGCVDNEGVSHWRWLGQGSSKAGIAYLLTQTRKTGIDLGLAMRLIGHSDQPVEYWDADMSPTLRQLVIARAGETIEATKLVGVATSRDCADPLALAQSRLDQSIDWNNAFAQHARVWEEEWHRCDVTIEGDEEAELATRFSLYHLLIAAPRRDNRVNIGAKTLSGFGYRGHAFWDTEIFMLPVFTYSAPHIARNLLDYRYLTLPAAREKARQAGFSGAWYAWESASTGEEVTPVWVPDFWDPKKLARVWTGDLAIHISADVAYAVHQYWQVTRDEAWFVERGVEIILETARFYASRAEWLSERNCYGYTDVIGPDEYHDHVNNNAYTNRLAQWNIHQALRTWDWLCREHPSQAGRLEESLGINTDILNDWREVADKICLNISPAGLYEQFDGFFQLKPFNNADYEPRSKSMHEIFGIEAANHYQAIKQPDVLMMQFLLKDEYRDEQIRVNYDYYNQRTDHTYGSSLGPSIQAMVACQMGDVEDAYEHFIRSARADLRDIRGNAGDGIHAASAGGTWQAVVFGFAGLEVSADGSWKINPRLPSHWKRITIRFVVHGQPHTVTVTHPGDA